MTDMRNVNNWHWVNKDCRPWAKKYFRDNLVGLSGMKQTGTTVEVTSLDSCEGDVDLNQRRGKLLAIYDVQLKLGWQGKSADGQRVYGTIFVPEVAYDTDNYVYQISVNNATSRNIEDEFKALIRSEVTTNMQKVFSTFTQDLIDNYSLDLYADKTTVPPLPELKQRKAPLISKQQPPKKPTPSKGVASADRAEPASVALRTNTVEHSYDFKGATAKHIYEALLNARMASVWSQGKVKVSKKLDSEFQLFDGNIHGFLLQTIPEKRIVQTWRLKNWPKDHYSTVTITFVNNSDGVTVHVKQVGVPVGQEEVIKTNWMGYYWKAIKDSSNKGLLDDLPYEREPTLFGFMDQKQLMVIVLCISLVLAITAYLVAPSFKL